jgi:Caspase domain
MKFRLFLLLAAVAFASSCSGKAETQRGPAEDDSVAASAAAVPASFAPSSGAVTGGQHKWALLVGINNYKYPDRVSPLAGSINDVEDIKAVLIGKFEFPPENILVLKDSQATHTGIISAIQRHLIANVQKNDIVVFHFSGHGSQMKDVTGKKISGLDETIVPWDSRDPSGQVFDISGAELHGLLLQLAAKTKNITFILDSCHSGTLVRGARVRGIPADDRKPPDQVPSYMVTTTRNLGDQGDNPPLKYAFIAAATSRETAFEHFADGNEHGALSYFLARQLRNSGAAVTYRDIMDNVAGNVTANYPAQRPQLEGAEADQFVFGYEASLSRSFVPVSPIDASRVLLGAGQVQGVGVDSTYDVYRPGTKTFAPPEKPIARLQVKSVGPFTSEAKLVSGARIPQFSRAIERDHLYGSRKLRIYFDGLAASPALQSVNAALAALPYVEMVSDPATSHMQIRESGGRVLTLAADATTLSPPVATNAPNLVNRLTEQVKGWAKWFNILSISNPQSNLVIEFSIKASATKDPLARVGRPDAGIFEDERIEASIKNVSGQDLYLSMLDLSSDGSISVVYPSEQGAAEVLKPGLTLAKTFTTVVPKGRSVVTDILKVFASSRPIDLTPLSGAAIREATAETDPLQLLLEASSGISRAAVALGTKPVSLGGWTTAQRVLVVKRKK